MGAILTIRYGTALDAATVAAELARAGTDWGKVRRALSDYLDPIAAVQGAKIVYSLDDVTAGTVLANVSVTATITFANITAGETLVIGNVTLTWAVAAANENQVTIGADLAAATTNLTAAINAHSKLQGIVRATGVTGTGVVTITYTGAGREAALIGLSETGDALVLSATSFTSAATLAAEIAAPVSVAKGL
ncbi:MAG: hypothetical protein MUF00_01645 [Gemmatimonadaceae bacterium]|jgi:hypothetical protein|nr:hypothetical protein [Gemmatimonadaceae bacterium]